MRPTLWLTLASLTTGCLSNTYRLADGELQRIAMTAPEERGRALRVVQRTSFSDDPPAQTVEQMPVAGCFGCGPNIWIGGGVYVGPHHSHAPQRIVTRAPAPAPLPPTQGPGTLRATPPGAGGAPLRATPPRTVYPTAGGGGLGGGGGGPKLDVKGDKGAAIVLVAAAAAFTVGLVATEGARYDGWVATAPDQPVHLRLSDGGYWSVPLWAVDQNMASIAEEAILVEGEYRGMQPLGRAPLDRKGATWRMEGGGFQLATTSTAGKELSMGGGANMGFGVFPHQKVGILATLALGGGTHLQGDVFTARYGVELDVMPLALGPLHLGGFGWGGLSYTASDGGLLLTQERNVGAGALGVLGELDLTTRLALSLRAGALTEFSGDHSGTPQWMFSAGFSVY